jgi:hypothetical protein
LDSKPSDPINPDLTLCMRSAAPRNGTGTRAFNDSLSRIRANLSIQKITFSVTSHR